MRALYLILAVGLMLAAPALAQDSDGTVAVANASEGDTQTGAAGAADAVDPAAEPASDPAVAAPNPMAPRDVADLTLEEFRWIARPIIVFADTPADPRFIEQMQLLAQRPDPLIARDAVILVDTDPDARSAIRTQLRPRGFALVVMQKDGSVGFRRPSPRDVREIVRGIDNFQFRQEELRSGGQ